MDINQNINNSRQPNRPFKPKFNFYWLYMMIGLFFIIMMFWNPSVSVREMPYSKLEQALRDGCVQLAEDGLSQAYGATLDDAGMRQRTDRCRTGS